MKGFFRRGGLATVALCCSFFSSPPLAAEEEPLLIRVRALEQAPVVDGDLKDWPQGEFWSQVEVVPALKNDAQVETPYGLQLAAGVHGDRLYVAVRWPDDSRDDVYRSWHWRSNKYSRDRSRDDMFAIRFHMNGTYDQCMLSQENYTVDVWKWSAGRSNLAGVAEDMTHQISTTPLTEAAEYGTPGQMVYIKKRPDAGEPAFANRLPPKKKQTPVLPSIELTGSGSGSLVDVTARGVWADGYWNLELSRLLDTGHEDDLRMEPGQRYLGAVAVFNKGYAEHKSINGNMLFDLSALPPAPAP